MEQVENYVLSEFKKNLDGIKNKKIVLYGTSHNTEVLLKNLSYFNIVGIMDGQKKSGKFCEKDILDYDDVIKKEIEVIVIIANSSTTRIIYNRIKEFCRLNRITLLNIFGEDLLEKEAFHFKDNKYFKKNKNELKKLIDCNEVISFDIFDTLLISKTLFPNDIFFIMSKKLNDNEFYNLRAESSKGNNLNIFEIYDNYQKKTHISDIEKKELIDLEIKTELSMLSCRIEMVEILEYAVSKGKKVYLISDMYFTKKILKEILDKLNITGYNDIFVSCEYRKLKSQGLYTIYKNMTQGNTYLHIGDDKESDGFYAEISGITSYLIKSAYEMLKISSYSEILDENMTFNERVMIGIFIEKAFNDPFVLFDSNGILKVSDPKIRGFLFVAPIVTCFMSWLINKLKNMDLETILFAARDGYMIYELYKLTENDNLPRGTYFLTSRFAGAISVSTDEETIKYFMSYQFDGEPETVLQKRFLLKEDDVLEFKDGENICDYALRHKDKIINIAKHQKENYLKYIKKNGIINQKRLGFFDLVSTGTTQMCIDKLLNCKTNGFYFGFILSDYSKKKELHVESLLNVGNAFEFKNYTFSNYVFLEYVLSSLDASLYYFSDEGDPVFLEDSRAQEEIVYIKQIQKGIVEYYLRYLSICDIVEEIELNIPDKLFGFMEDKYSNMKDYNLKDSMMVKNEFGNSEFVIKEIKEIKE